MKFLITAFISTLCVLSIPIDGFGQDEDKPVRVETELVSINVTVIDGAGKPVEGLTQRQFEIYDNEAKQNIEHFSAATAGVTYGIVYDMHPTTEQRTNAVLNSLREFTKNLPETDDHFFVVFNERGSLTLDFVPDPEQLKRHLASPEKREPRSLYDALYLAAEKLRQTRNPKRTLLVITDAADHRSRRSFNELRNELRKFDVQVYAIMLDETLNRFDAYIDITRRDELPPKLSDASPNDRAALSSITLRTGGATFPSSLEDPTNILRISNQVAAEMRNQYTLSFYPSARPDGKWHMLRVGLNGVRGSNKFVLTYRLGYQAQPVRKD
jgi:VWFA-related protein